MQIACQMLRFFHLLFFVSFAIFLCWPFKYSECCTHVSHLVIAIVIGLVVAPISFWNRIIIIQHNNNNNNNNSTKQQNKENSKFQIGVKLNLCGLVNAIGQWRESRINGHSCSLATGNSNFKKDYWLSIDIIQIQIESKGWIDYNQIEVGVGNFVVV